MIKAIAVDDEPLALSIIQHYCDQLENITLEKVFTQQNEAIKHLNKFPVDVLFLDIQMPRQNGLDFFKSLKKKPLVIFTTAFSDYAVSGFNVNAIDYLLKPFTYERFVQAIKKAEEKLQYKIGNSDQNYVLIRADYKLHKIEFDTILFIEAFDDYIKIFLVDTTKIVARMSLKGILKKLPNNDFIRTHRSYIVPVKHIKTLQNNTITVADYTIPIGNTYKKNVINFLQ